MTETKNVVSFEESWDVEVSGPQSNATFLRLKNGESAVLRILSKPFKVKDHWHDGRSVMCGKDHGVPCPICGTVDPDGNQRWPRTRWGFSVYVHGAQLGGASKMEPIEEPRVFEVSNSTFQTIQAVVKEIVADGGNWKDTDLKITRGGEERKPIYTVLPRTKSLPVPEDTEIPDLNALYTARLAKAAGNTNGNGNGQPDPFENE